MDVTTITFLGVSLIVILAVLLAIIVSSLPLYLSVLVLGGEASIFTVFFTNLLMAFFTFIAVKEFGFGALVIIAITIVVYTVMFKLGFIKAFFAWILQYLVAGLLVYLAVLLGVILPVYF